ncbi:MAG: homocysteine S-methyltransferase family protein [Deltaproteobacteria bacterium]|nr:homocysteine S-methyltransferase family protein [Deltaproteobacteria bacterium]
MTHAETNSLLETLKNHPVILDGAVGTELDNRGMDTRSTLWSGLASLKQPGLLEEVHREYVDAGAQILTTATFRTTERAFMAAGRPADQWRMAAREAVRIARRAATDRIIVAGCVAPLEDCFSPEMAPNGKEARNAHSKLCRELVSAGVDALWLETFGALGELEAAVSAAIDAGQSHRFGVSVTTDASGDLISGESLMDAAELARSSGAVCFCINCIPPNHVEAALAKLVSRVDLPIGIYANLGFAEGTQDWKGSAHLSPPAYARLAAGWVHSGVRLIGGCCGSTPAHVSALSSYFTRKPSS